MLGELAGHNDDVVTLAFTPDGSLLASGGHDQMILIWDMENPGRASSNADRAQQLGIGCEFQRGWTDAGLRQCGWYAAPVGRYQRGGSGQPLSDHTGWVRSVVFSPDGSLLASGSGDRSIILRDASTGQRLADIPPMIGHTDEVHALAFSPDGSQLLSGDEQGDILVWRTAPSQPLHKR